MKKLLTISVIIFAVVFASSCKKESALEYNNGIIEQQMNIVYKIDALKKAIDKYNYLDEQEALRLIDLAYDSVCFQIDSGLNYVNNIDGFKGDEELKIAAVNLFTSYKDIVEQNYKQIIELYKLPVNLFTQTEQQKLSSLLEDSSKKLQEAFDTFSAVQKEFADKNNLKVD